MKLKFSKMHGLGNDFVIIDGTEHNILLSSKQIQRLADRHRGVGFDQLLLIEKSEQTDYDFRYRIFNADGSEVEQCGNGARCAAKFIQHFKLSQKSELHLQTLNGAIRVELKDDGLVSVDMGPPRFEPAQVPFIVDQMAVNYKLMVDQQEYSMAVLSVGNPHAVLLVDKVSTAPVNELGSKIELHAQFPKRVNVGFMEIVNRQQIKLRVFERGTGETQACGTGACAAVVAGQRLGLLDHDVTVSLRGGDLQIFWAGEQTSIMMTGPAEFVFHGVI